MPNPYEPPQTPPETSHPSFGFWMLIAILTATSIGVMGGYTFGYRAGYDDGNTNGSETMKAIGIPMEPGPGTGTIKIRHDRNR